MTATPTPEALLAEHQDYVTRLAIEHCPEYVGRSTNPGELFTELATGVALTSRGDNGEPVHWFVPDDNKDTSP